MEEGEQEDIKINEMMLSDLENKSITENSEIFQ